MNLISTVADPRLVCMEIGICNFEKQTVHLLGGKKCAWGPGYWCQSVAHAKGCDVSITSITNIRIEKIIPIFEQ